MGCQASHTGGRTQKQVGASLLKRPLGATSTLEEPLVKQERDDASDELNEESRFLRVKMALDLANSMSREQRCNFAEGMVDEGRRKMNLLQHAASMHGKSSFANAVASLFIGRRHQHENSRPLPLHGRDFPECVHNLCSAFDEHLQFFDIHKSECVTALFWQPLVAYLEMADSLLRWKELDDA